MANIAGYPSAVIQGSPGKGSKIQALKTMLKKEFKADANPQDIKDQKGNGSSKIIVPMKNPSSE